MGNYLQYLHQSLLFTYLRFGKWDEILKEPVVDTLSYTPVLQHFARGIALARLGRFDEALSEAALMDSKMQNPVLREPLTPFSAVYEGAQVAKALLDGVIATEQNNLSLAVKRFEEAVKQEEKIIYAEPRDWLLPARHYLGDALLRVGRNEEAVAVLQQDLTINPSNGWAIIGLQMAFEKLNRSGDIITAKNRLKNAWLAKDVEIKRPVF
jgi:tetratricopeptide (TPR) repeat protein